jgi:hypothetical protein
VIRNFGNLCQEEQKGMYGGERCARFAEPVFTVTKTRPSCDNGRTVDGRLGSGTYRVGRSPRILVCAKMIKIDVGVLCVVWLQVLTGLSEQGWGQMTAGAGGRWGLLSVGSCVGIHL